MPVRTCMWKPPMPISFIWSISRRSWSSLSSQFQAQKGAARYSLGGLRKVLSSRAGFLFSGYSMVSPPFA